MHVTCMLCSVLRNSRITWLDRNWPGALSRIDVGVPTTYALRASQFTRLAASKTSCPLSSSLLPRLSYFVTCLKAVIVKVLYLATNRPFRKKKSAPPPHKSKALRLTKADFRIKFNYKSLNAGIRVLVEKAAVSHLFKKFSAFY
jgi:hypothetical protein